MNVKQTTLTGALKVQPKRPNKVRISCTIRPELDKEIEVLAESIGASKSEIVERGIELVIAKAKRAKARGAR